MGSAILVTGDGTPEELVWAPASDPILGPGDVLIAVEATAFNNADALQRRGTYPPPPGASDILGLECAGTVAAIGADVTEFRVGDRVCALLAGGGYAQHVSVPWQQVLPVPDGLSMIEASALPEAMCTVWSNIPAPLRNGAGLDGAARWALIHGASGGVGSLASRMLRAIGYRIVATAGDADRAAACTADGAVAAFSYRSPTWASDALDATDGARFSFVLDVAGAKNLADNVSVLADLGHIAVIALQGGSRTELDLGALMRRRGSLSATTLRARPLPGAGGKAEIVADVRADLWPLVASGRIRPLIGAVEPIVRGAASVHRASEDGRLPVGKVVLTVPSA